MTNITITGDLGSGKSSVTRILKEELGFEVISVGGVQRQLAKEYGLDTIGFNKYMESHPELGLDEELDRRVAKLGRQQDNLIFDSRLAWHFVENSFKIYLSVDDEIAARRVFGDKNRMSETYSSLEEAKVRIRERRESEINRFKARYGIVLNDFSHYDLVIDTSFTPPAVVAGQILSAYKLYAGENPQERADT
jgi:cytidylate kinase